MTHWGTSGISVGGIDSVSASVFSDVLNGNTYNGSVYTWLSSGNTNFDIGFLIDRLSATMMVVVLSGYVGRFLLARVAKGARGRAGELATLQAALAGGALPNRAKAPPITGLTRFLFERQGKSEPVTREEVALALADVEGAVRAEQAMQRLLKRWTDLHIVTGVLLTVLLVLHVWAGFYFGLRWL